MIDPDVYVFELKEVVHVVDGDTYDLILDVGFHQQQASRFRLNGWDTPELRRGTEFEKEQAAVATRTVEEWLDKHYTNGTTVYARTHKADSFGRWLVDLFVPGDDLGQMLGALELATAWPQRWHEVYDNE